MAAGTAVSTAAGAGADGTAGGVDGTGTTGVTGPVPGDWEQPAVNMHATTKRKRRIQ